jgi:hypothetical protein
MGAVSSGWTSEQWALREQGGPTSGEASVGSVLFHVGCAEGEQGLGSWRSLAGPMDPPGDAGEELRPQTRLEGERAARRALPINERQRRQPVVDDLGDDVLGDGPGGQRSR